MTEAKFTRGPWRAAIAPNDIRRNDERELEVCCLPHSELEAIDIFAPAVGEEWNSAWAEPTLDEFLANAHLIAGATELYEAAGRAIEIIKANLYRQTEKVEDVVIILEEALAKARGEQP